jgi:uncharacterized protein (DUF983 family)
MWYVATYQAEHKSIDLNVFKIENKPSACAGCHFEINKTMAADGDIFFVYLIMAFSVSPEIFF